MSEIEEKQWVVSRLDALHHTTFDELQLSREDFADISREETSNIRGVLRTYLSACTVILAVLVGLYSSDLSHTKLLEVSSSSSITYGSLFWTLLLGVTILAISVFAVANYTIRKITIMFNNIGNSIVHAQENLNHNYGYLIKNTVWLKDVSIDSLKNYYDFMLLLSTIVYIPFTQSLNEGAKLKFLDAYYKTYFSEQAIELESLIDKTIPSFNKIDKKDLPQELIKKVSDIISSYKK